MAKAAVRKVSGSHLLQWDRTVSWSLVLTIPLSYALLLGWRLNRGDEKLLARLIPEAIEPALVVVALVCVYAALGIRETIEKAFADYARRYPDKGGPLLAIENCYRKEILSPWRFALAAVGAVTMAACYRVAGLGVQGVWPVWPEYATRTFAAVSAAWAVWPSVVSAGMLRSGLDVLAPDLDAFYPDGCGGLDRLGCCLLRTSVPATGVFGVSVLWLCFAILDLRGEAITVTDLYIPLFAAAVLLGVVLPIILRVFSPFWRAHRLLVDMQRETLDRLWPEKRPLGDRLSAFKERHEALAYVRDMSTWPAGRVASIGTLLWSQMTTALVASIARMIRA